MTTFCINLSNQQVSEYSGFDALAFERINGNYFAICADGIYLIGGAESPQIPQDDGQPINAVITLGKTDFKKPNLKRCDYAYVGSVGEITLRMGVDANKTTGPYDATHNGVGIGTRRVKMGKGTKSRYWQPTIENVNGSFFEIESIDIDPELLSRKVS